MGFGPLSLAACARNNVLPHLIQAVRLLPVILFLLHLSGCAGLMQLTEEDRAQAAGKTFVVTGASSGIGRGIAEQLGALGANVVLAARRTDLLEEVAAVVRGYGGNPLVVTTDVSRNDQMERLARLAVERFGGIDVWINNAGVAVIGRFEEAPVEDHARVVDVNLKGVIYGSHAALTQFRKQGHGSLVNVSSLIGRIPIPYQSSYVASKAGILALGRVINQELQLAGHDRITVTSVLPWAVDTPFFEHAANYTGHKARSAAYDDPRMVAEAIVWVSLHPRRELPVGWKALAAYAGHNLLPGITERIAASVEHQIQIEGAPAAPPSQGNLYEPMRTGRTVGGGLSD